MPQRKKARNYTSSRRRVPANQYVVKLRKLKKAWQMLSEIFPYGAPFLGWRNGNASYAIDPEIPSVRSWDNQPSLALTEILTPSGSGVLQTLSRRLPIHDLLDSQDKMDRIIAQINAQLPSSSLTLRQAQSTGSSYRGDHMGTLVAQQANSPSSPPASTASSGTLQQSWQSFPARQSELTAWYTRLRNWTSSSWNSVISWLSHPIG